MKRKPPVPAVFVLMGNDIESNRPLMAFATKKLAEDCKVACEAYDLTVPECPLVEDTKANDRLWDQWTQKRARWQRNHPAGPDAGCYGDGYSIVELELKA